MNILFLINYAGNGGSEKYVQRLTDAFTKRGHTCFLAYNEEGRLSEDFKARGIKTLRLDLLKSGFVKSPKILAEFCRGNNIDIIHAQYPAENVIAVRSLKYNSKPRVFFTSHLAINQGIKWRVLNKLYTPKDSGVIALFKDAVPLLTSNGVDPCKISLIENGVEIPPQRIFPEDEVFKMCIMARLSEDKGLDFLTDSLAKLKKITDRKFSVYVLGEGPLLDELKIKRDALGLTDNISYEGFCDNIQEYLDKSVLYLNSSPSEAASFAILEAMASGLAIVATDTGGNSEIVSGGQICGTLVPYGDTDAFAGAIKNYIDNKELLIKHGEAARNKAKALYSLDAMAEKVLRLYES